jgi:hypothetical protein
MKTWYTPTNAIKHLPTTWLETLTSQQTHERRTWYIVDAFKNVTSKTLPQNECLRRGLLST